MNSSIETATPTEGIAIIGMSGRFPQANNIQSFWDNLCQGLEGVRFFSDEELRAAGVSESTDISQFR